MYVEIEIRLLRTKRRIHREYFVLRVMVVWLGTSVFDFVVTCDSRWDGTWSTLG